MTKNLHLEHPEDDILSGNLNVLNWFVESGNLSLKVDGSPAIVWGTDPATNTFFVGTKSVFNKNKIRIAHNHEEIDIHYDGYVAEILHSCFNYLPRFETIYQGDFIGFGGENEYKSNIITYQFPEVVSQKIIIAPHTCYYANSDLRNAEAFPDRSIWIDTETVKFVKPDAWIAHNQTSFADVEDVCNFARQMSTTVQFVDKKGEAHLKKVFNTFIKTGAVLDDEALATAGNCDINLIRLWKLVKSIKEDCLFLCRNNGPNAYIGFDRIDSEGYVMFNKYGMYKLVNREIFSYANFNYQKNWCK